MTGGHLNNAQRGESKIRPEQVMYRPAGSCETAPEFGQHLLNSGWTCTRCALAATASTDTGLQCKVSAPALSRPACIDDIDFQSDEDDRIVYDDASIGQQGASKRQSNFERRLILTALKFHLGAAGSCALGRAANNQQAFVLLLSAVLLCGRKNSERRAFAFLQDL